MLKNLSFDVKQRIVVTFNLYEDAAKIRKISPNVKLQLKRYGMKDENYYDVAKFCIDNDVHALNLSIYNVKDKGIKYLNSRGIHVFAAVDFYLIINIVSRKEHLGLYLISCLKMI